MTTGMYPQQKGNIGRFTPNERAHCTHGSQRLLDEVGRGLCDKGQLPAPARMANPGRAVLT